MADTVIYGPFIDVATGQPVGMKAVELSAGVYALAISLDAAALAALENVQIGSIAAGNNNIGDVDVASSALPAGAATAANQTTANGYLGPSTPYFNSALLATKQAVKASAGRLTYYHIENPNTSDAWVQFFDAASGSVTVGTTTPTLSLWVPAGGALDAALSSAVNFATAITIAATTTATGSTAPSTGLVVNLLYQ